MRTGSKPLHRPASGDIFPKREKRAHEWATAADMLTSASTQQKFDQWQARLSDDDEATRVEATAKLVEVANESRELRAQCLELLAQHLQSLLEKGCDLSLSLQELSNLSRGLVSSSEALMKALMKLPIRDSYAINMATDILLYEMSQGFIGPHHALRPQVLDMASQVVSHCKGNARRHALQILSLAEADIGWQPSLREA